MKSIKQLQSTNQSFFPFFSLRMRRMKKDGCCCFAALSAIWKSWFSMEERWVSEPAVGFGFVVVFACAVMGAAAPMLRKRRRQAKPNKTNKERVRPASPTWAAVALRSDEWSKQQSELAEQQGNCAAIVGRPATINSSFLHQSNQLNQKSLVCWGLNEKKRLNLIDCPAHTSIPSNKHKFPFPFQFNVCLWFHSKVYIN